MPVEGQGQISTWEPQGPCPPAYLRPTLYLWYHPRGGLP